MADRRRLYLVSSRQRLLLCVLVALATTLAAFSGRLLLSHRLSSARQALRQGQTNSAIKTLLQCSDRGSRSPEWNYLLALAFRRNGQFAEAEKSLARAKDLGWNPDDIKRQELLTKARRGEAKKVESQLVELLDSGVSDEVAEEIYEAMAQGYWSSYYIGDALQCLQYWSRWQPKNPVPQLWIANLYERTRRPETAIPEYRKVLEIDPDNEEALGNLGNLLLGKLELEEAAKTFVQLLSVSREAHEGLLGLADCLRRQSSNEEAKELLYEALTLDLEPRDTARATGTLGTLALEEHDYARAAQLLHDSIAMDPNNAAFHVSMAAALSALGQDEMAAAERQTAREMSDRYGKLVLATTKVGNDPENPDLRCEAGLLLMKQGFWTEGADWIKTALAIAPNHAAAHEAMADFYEHAGNLELAQQHRIAAGQSPVGAAPTDEGG